MLRNDYRRALILLRAVEPGLSGHVRLERRTLMGSMSILVNGAPNSAEELEAALLARTPCGWKTAHIGTLRRDSRGQAGLGWTFDPRSIEGLALEEYSLIVILGTEACFCRLLMTGFLNGSVEVDWNRVREAACASYGFGGTGAQTPQPRSDEIEEAPAEASEGEAPSTISDMDASAIEPISAGALDETDAQTGRTAPEQAPDEMDAKAMESAFEQTPDDMDARAAESASEQTPDDMDTRAAESAPEQTPDDMDQRAEEPKAEETSAALFDSSLPKEGHIDLSEQAETDALPGEEEIDAPAMLSDNAAALIADTAADAARDDADIAGDALASAVREGHASAETNMEDIPDDFDLPAEEAAGVPVSVGIRSSEAAALPEDFDLPAVDPASALTPFDTPSAEAASAALTENAIGFSAEPEPFDIPAAEAITAAAAESEQPSYAVFSAKAGRAPTALEALRLPRGERWPESIEPLRETFASSEPYAGLEREGYVFVRLPQGEECLGCAVGVRAEGGRPRSVAYAVPGAAEGEPPAGLEGYEWKDGWWMVYADAETGALEI